jgi:hypothetical protein
VIVAQRDVAARDQPQDLLVGVVRGVGDEELEGLALRADLDDRVAAGRLGGPQLRS